MEKSKVLKLIEKWWLDGPRNYSRAWLSQYGVDSFIDWLYKNGFTIETRFQGEDLKKQEELIGHDG